MSEMNIQRRRNVASPTEPVPETKKEDTDGYDDDDDSKSKRLKLTLMEEVLLIGLKDRQVVRSDLGITTVKEARKRPFPDRYIQVIDATNTGEVLLDETLKLLKLDNQSISNWIDLLSGETWNVMKVGYQLKQVRERLAKGLVDKGVLRTEKKNFVVFDMATHPLSDTSVKDEIIARVVGSLLGVGPAPNLRTIALLCAAYAANVLDNALANLNHSQKEQCFNKADQILHEYAALSEKSANKNNEIIAGVFSVFSKMDSVLY